MKTKTDIETLAHADQALQRFAAFVRDHDVVLTGYFCRMAGTKRRPASYSAVVTAINRAATGRRDLAHEFLADSPRDLHTLFRLAGLRGVSAAKMQALCESARKRVEQWGQGHVRQSKGLGAAPARETPTP